MQAGTLKFPEQNLTRHLSPYRDRLHSRQASNNSNQQSSLDDSGVVDDHDGDDVTSVEDHEKREQTEESENFSRNESVRPDQVLVPVTVSVRTGNREIRVLKYNGIKSNKDVYALPQEYLSHIVILGKCPRRKFQKKKFLSA